MSRATSRLRDLAEHLVAYETKANNSPDPTLPTALLIFGKLRPHLATLMGNAGFRALLARALVVAGAGVPWLRSMRLKADGSFEGMDNLEPHLDPKEIVEGRVVLLAELLGLLMAFIGENLTLGLMREVWPKVALDDFDFSKGGKHEKTK